MTRYVELIRPVGLGLRLAVAASAAALLAGCQMLSIGEPEVREQAFQPSDNPVTIDSVTYEITTNSLNIDTPLTSAPAKGKKVFWLEGNNGGAAPITPASRPRRPHWAGT